MRTTTEPNQPTATRIRRATTRLAVAALVTAPAIVLTAEVAHARIAVNHNETAGRDGR